MACSTRGLEWRRLSICLRAARLNTTPRQRTCSSCFSCVVDPWSSSWRCDTRCRYVGIPNRRGGVGQLCVAVDLRVGAVGATLGAMEQRVPPGSWAGRHHLPAFADLLQACLPGICGVHRSACSCAATRAWRFVQLPRGHVGGVLPTSAATDHSVSPLLRDVWPSVVIPD